jgi:hypothetical protein
MVRAKNGSRRKRYLDEQEVFLNALPFGSDWNFFKIRRLLGVFSASVESRKLPAI